MTTRALVALAICPISDGSRSVPNTVLLTFVQNSGCASNQPTPTPNPTAAPTAAVPTALDTDVATPAVVTFATVSPVGNSVKVASPIQLTVSIKPVVVGTGKLGVVPPPMPVGMV